MNFGIIPRMQSVRTMKPIFFFVLSLIFLTSPIFAESEADRDLDPAGVVKTEKPESYYDELYPYYVELCALSQIAKKGQGKGGSAGHAVLYLKGVCKDEDASYPRIKMCEASPKELRNPDVGVGVSVNKIYKNVNWVAVPTKKLFFYGGLREKDVLNEKRFEKAIRMAVNDGVFRGIEIHDEYLKAKPEDMSLERFIAEDAIGTDYALTFGRSIFCERLPVTEAMLGRMIDFLNGLNEEYDSGKANYDWSGYHDNCAHTVHNALAAADVWSMKKINTRLFRQLFNLAIPANEFCNLVFLVNEGPLDDVSKIEKNKQMHNTLLNYDWLPMRHGALLKTVSVQQKNDLYDTRFNIFLLQNPLHKAKAGKIRKMLEDDRYRHIKKNLLYYKDRYEEILDDSKKNSEDNKFAQAYHSYIEEQLSDVEEKLKKL